MSLESYRKALEAQRKRDEEYSQPPEQAAKTECADIEHPESHKRSFGWYIGAIIIAILFFAALKNPSKKEAKTEILTAIVEDSNIRRHLRSELGILFASSFIDAFVQTDISDFIFYSTFEVSMPEAREERPLASGIILFGKVIILKNYIRKEPPSDDHGTSI